MCTFHVLVLLEKTDNSYIVLTGRFNMKPYVFSASWSTFTLSLAVFLRKRVRLILCKFGNNGDEFFGVISSHLSI